MPFAFILESAFTCASFLLKAYGIGPLPRVERSPEGPK
jgi:hypothetical protein